MKKLIVVFVAIFLVFTACTPVRQQQRPIQEQQEEDILEAKGDLETDISAIYDPGEVRNCRITADTVDVKVGTGNNFSTIGNLKKNDVVKVLREVGNWYVIQTDDYQIGAIDAENATPVVKDTDVARVPQTPLVQQQSQQQGQQEPRQQGRMLAKQEQNQVDQQQEPRQQGQMESGQEQEAKATEQQAPAPTPAPAPQQPTTNRLSAQEQEMVNLVNQERTKNGLPALQVDLEVARVAGIKSQDMADNNYFSHNSPTYGSPFDMMKNFGVSYLHAGENLAGNSTVQRAHEALMNSSGHRQNILSPNFTHIGVGIRPSDKYGYLYTQMFISKPK